MEGRFVGRRGAERELRVARGRFGGRYPRDGVVLIAVGVERFGGRLCRSGGEGEGCLFRESRSRLFRGEADFVVEVDARLEVKGFLTAFDVWLFSARRATRTSKRSWWSR